MPVRRLEPLHDPTRQRFVRGDLEERREVLGAEFVEATVQRLLLPPVGEPLLKLACVWRALQGGFVSGDRLVETTGPIVQVTEPACRSQVTRIEGKGALEAGLRHVILPEHERGDAGAEAQARVAGLHRRRLGERHERVTEALLFDRGRPGARESDRVVLRARASGGDRSREHQHSRSDQKSDRQSTTTWCKKNTLTRCGYLLVFSSGCSQLVYQRVYKSRPCGSRRKCKFPSST